MSTSLLLTLLALATAFGAIIVIMLVIIGMILETIATIKKHEQKIRKQGEVEDQ